MMLVSCDISVLHRPPDMQIVDTIRMDGVTISCLDPAALTRENLFAVSFDDVLARLSRQGRTDVEPDGFFVRTGEEAGHFWRLNGHLFELDQRLWRVDLRGECPGQALDEILTTLDWPAASIIVQLVQQGVTVEEADFRRWAGIT